MGSLGVSAGGPSGDSLVPPSGGLPILIGVVGRRCAHYAAVAPRELLGPCLGAVGPRHREHGRLVQGSHPETGRPLRIPMQLPRRAIVAWLAAQSPPATAVRYDGVFLPRGRHVNAN